VSLERCCTCTIIRADALFHMITPGEGEAAAERIGAERCRQRKRVGYLSPKGPERAGVIVRQFEVTVATPGFIVCRVVAVHTYIKHTTLTNDRKCACGADCAGESSGCCGSLITVALQPAHLHDSF
jgi:hypothetical protein